MGDVKNIVRSGFYSYFCFGSFPVTVLEHLDKNHLKEEGFISAHSSTVQFILSEKGQKQQKVVTSVVRTESSECRHASAQLCQLDSAGSFKMGLPTLVNANKAIPHQGGPEFSLRVVLDYVKLTTSKSHQFV